MSDILNVRGAMNCATTNAFFVNEMLSFRNGISCNFSSNHHSSGWRPHPLGWGGKPAPIVKIQTRKNFEILSFRACGEAFPIQTVD